MAHSKTRQAAHKTAQNHVKGLYECSEVAQQFTSIMVACNYSSQLKKYQAKYQNRDGQ